MRLWAPAFERYFAEDGIPLVAAFAQASGGDVSPNLRGTPDGIHDHERMEIIAKRQLGQALELCGAARSKFAPNLDYRHSDMKFASHAVEGKRPEFMNDARFLLAGLRWWFAKIRGRL